MRRGPLPNVLFAWLLISASQWAFTIAAGVLAFGVAGAGGTSMVAVARLVPAMIAAPLVGAVLDRVDRSLAITVSCVLQAGAVAGAAAIAATGAPLAALVGVTAVASIGGTPCRPAVQAVLPALARTPQELTRATAVWSGADSAGFLIGAGFGGLTIALAGTATMMWSAAALLVLSALLAARLPATAAIADDDGADDMPADRAVLAGLRIIRDTSMLHVPLALFGGLLLLDGASDVQLTALTIRQLHLGSGGPGLVYAVWGVGGLLGSAALVLVVRRRGYGLALFAGALMFGAVYAVCGFGGPAVAVAAMIPVGVGFAFAENAVLGIVPRLADDAVVGRVYGITELMYAGMAAIGAALAPVLIRLLGISASLLADGAALAVATAFGWASCARLDHGEQTAHRVRDLLRGVPFLAALPLPVLERLVRGAQAHHVAAGSTIFRLGDVGSDFYVIERGTVEIVEFGRQQSAGDGFGEIALLRDVPRTATVRTRSDTALWSVARGSFLAAVGALTETRRAADAVVDEHLARPPVERPHRDG